MTTHAPPLTAALLCALCAISGALRGPFTRGVADASGAVFLSPMLQKGDITGAREASRVAMSSIHAGRSHAGYITADASLGNHVFFWYFPARDPAAPLLVWMNGGPGVSSLLGVVWEHGPLELSEAEWAQGRLSWGPREHAWAGPFSVVYVDAPVGVGLSYSDSGDQGIRKTAKGYTQDLLSFLKQFYEIFQEPGSDIYIGGQGYGAKFSIKLAEAVTHDPNYGSLDLPLPLKGVYFGNPMFAFQTQMCAYYDFLYAMGFQTKAAAEASKAGLRSLFKEIEGGKSVSVMDIGMVAYAEINLGFSSASNFDFAVDVDARARNFTNDPEIRRAIHGRTGHFEPYNWTMVDMTFGQDFTIDATEELGRLLDAGLKVLVYSGNYDASTSSNAADAALLATPWAGGAEFAQARRAVWAGPNGVKGYYSRTNNLCRVVVHKAGMMAPHDRPGAVLQMMKDFTSHGCIQA